MTDDNTGRSRRDFFYLAGALAIRAASGPIRVKAVDPVSPQIGILLATTFATGTLEARLDAGKVNGLACRTDEHGRRWFAGDARPDSRRTTR